MVVPVGCYAIAIDPLSKCVHKEKQFQWDVMLLILCQSDELMFSFYAALQCLFSDAMFIF